MNDGTTWTYALTGTEIVTPDAMHIVGQSRTTRPPSSPATPRARPPSASSPLPPGRLLGARLGRGGVRAIITGDMQRFLTPSLAWARGF